MAQDNDNATLCVEVQTSNFEGEKIRFIAEDEPTVVAADLAKILGIRDAANLARTLDDDEKGTREVSTPSGVQKMTVVTESGMYSAILKREAAYVKDPEARAKVKRFQRWVTHEVLPSIRKHGGYMAGQERMTPEQMLAASMRWLESRIREQEETIASQSAQLEEQKPKVLFADAVSASDGTCLVGELAKMLRQNGVQVGQNRLFARLREDGWLGKSGGNRNVPTQKAMERGLFRIKETAVTHSDGHVTISRTAKVTGAGQRFFIGLYGAGAKPLDGLEVRDEAR